ncbi:MAG: hypothetical protein RLY56_736, partial [Pseudomonadota bacterium]
MTLETQRHSLVGKVALITGGARRVGAAIARELHAAGANVVIHHHRSVDAAQTLCAELEQVRRDSTLRLSADLLDTVSLGNLVEETRRHFGKLDILINNASTFYPTPVGEITLENWDDLIGSNLKAPLFLSQAA